ncbi:hypothetical protein FN846DRAFT_222184 [Sphaerosporella brunnea]|uniref:Uncharacterized protein n=1 Tax=Sphaerosporella brunnea TaxID=1250544 RepID=A0A5J5F7Z9_9PEZI|nr:hypothetical protein FN846DRAFT_222184 [Sphaerosporella brunnea]
MRRFGVGIPSNTYLAFTLKGVGTALRLSSTRKPREGRCIPFRHSVGRKMHTEGHAEYVAFERLYQVPHRDQLPVGISIGMQNTSNRLKLVLWRATLIGTLLATLIASSSLSRFMLKRWYTWALYLNCSLHKHFAISIGKEAFHPAGCYVWEWFCSCSKRWLVFPSVHKSRAMCSACCFFSIAWAFKNQPQLDTSVGIDMNPRHL